MNIQRTLDTYYNLCLSLSVDEESRHPTLYPVRHYTLNYFVITTTLYPSCSLVEDKNDGEEKG